MDDALYLKKKEQLNLFEELIYYEERKRFYDSVMNMMASYKIKNTQERFLFSDIQKLVTYFEYKIEIIKIKLKDVS